MTREVMVMDEKQAGGSRAGLLAQESSSDLLVHSKAAS